MIYPSEHPGLTQLSSTLSAWHRSSLSAHKPDVHMVLNVQGKMAMEKEPLRRLQAVWQGEGATVLSVDKWWQCGQGDKIPEATVLA